MSKVVVDSHDLLGKLTIIKNCLSILMEDQKYPGNNNNYLQQALNSTQNLIDLIKNAKNIHG